MESQSLYQDLPPAAPIEKASVVEDIIDVFYAPSRVFERRREGGFGLTLLLLCAISAVVFFATKSVLEPVYDATFEQSMKVAMQQNPQMAANAQAAMEAGRKFAGIGVAVMAVAGPALIALFAGVLVFFVTRLFDLRPTFGQAMTITTIANIPRFALSTLVSAVQAFALPSDQTRTAYTIAVSPARFLPEDTSLRLVGLAMRFELFTLWATVLIGIGVAVVCRTDRKKGMLVGALVWFVASLLGVAFQR